MNKDDKKRLPILNKNNKLITQDDIQRMLRKANIKNLIIHDLDIWQRAFVHKSYSKNNKKKNTKSSDTYDSESSYGEGEGDCDSDTEGYIEIQELSNERLEWMGDGILQSVVATYLWKRFPKEDEGFLTKTRSKLVKTDALSKFAEYLGFKEYIMMSTHVELVCFGRENPKFLENTFEAFIGALFVNCEQAKNVAYAYKVTDKFIINIIEKCIDMPELIMKDDNYKDQLMRYYQKIFEGKYPIYKEDDCSGPPNNRIFKMKVADIHGNIVGVGEGRSKKDAEQNAAHCALKYFKLI